MAAVALAACVLWVFRATLARYLADQHYQEHFLYLWILLALALWRTARGPYRARCGWGDARDRTGLALAAGALLCLTAHELGGSNVVGRTALALCKSGVDLAWVGRAVPAPPAVRLRAWVAARCRRPLPLWSH